MANIATTFTSGLVLGSGAVYAFVSHFTDRSELMQYRLRRSSAWLKEAATNEIQDLPKRWSTKPELMNRYQQLMSRMSSNSAPLAKSMWNANISSTAQNISNFEVDADQIAKALVPK